MMTARKICWYLSFVGAFLIGSVAAKASEYNAASCQAVVGTLNIHWEALKHPRLPGCNGISYTDGTFADAADGNISMSTTSVSTPGCLQLWAYTFTLSPDKSTLSGGETTYNVPMTLTRGPGEDCFVGHWVSGPYDYLAHIAAAPFLSSAANYQGLFWAAPAGSESGWGINFAHQGDVIFATWFTYDATGKALWLSMTATKTAEGVYAGTIYQTSGPPFSATPFDPAAVTATAVGSGTLTFSDIDNGSLAYTVFGVTQTKPITRQVFGALPVCTWGGMADLALATNYQDLWWAAPAGFESGWGVNFTHQGDVIFATWFTYDSDGTPLWLSATINKVAPGVYTGTLYRTTGPAFNAEPFLPASVALTPVGTLTVTFANGNSATFASTVNGVAQSKEIVRQVFRTPGTVCQ